MNIYSLTKNGRQKFERMRDNLRITQEVGYQILEYLYENGTGTVAEIVSGTGAPHSQVMAKLKQFIGQKLVEVMAEL